jgi:hypothetical protein
MKDTTILCPPYGYAGRRKIQLHAFKKLALNDIQPNIGYSCYI